MAIKRFTVEIDGPEVSKQLSDMVLKCFEEDDNLVKFLEALGVDGAMMRVYEDDELQFSKCIGSL